MESIEDDPFDSHHVLPNRYHVPGTRPHPVGSPKVQEDDEERRVG